MSAPGATTRLRVRKVQDTRPRKQSLAAAAKLQTPILRTSGFHNCQKLWPTEEARCSLIPRYGLHKIISRDRLVASCEACVSVHLGDSEGGNASSVLTSTDLQAEADQESKEGGWL